MHDEHCNRKNDYIIQIQVNATGYNSERISYYLENGFLMDKFNLKENNGNQNILGNSIMIRDVHDLSKGQ